MALVLADRVKVTTTTTGTGAVALGAAQAGCQDFSVLSNGDTTYYCIVDNATGAWEVGLGTYASAGPSLARTSVIASSTGTAVSFGAGPKDVFITLPAERAVTTDGADFSGPVTVPAGATGSQVPQAQEVGRLAFASGTKMLFAQTAAPTGWTKDTTHNNKALRVVTGTAGSGGSVAFTTAFASQAVSGTVGNTTLTVAQMPSHQHTTPQAAFGRRVAAGTSFWLDGRSSLRDEPSSFVGGGGAHNHTFTGTAINLAVQYVDVIIATKN